MNAPSRTIILIWLLVSGFGWGPAVQSESVESPAVREPVTVPGRAGGEQDLPIEVDADRLEYDWATRVLEAIGDVVVRQGVDTLYADYVRIDLETQDALVQGNIRFERVSGLWQGESLRYNFATQTGDIGPFVVHNEPYFVSAREARQVSTNRVEMRGVRLTTCAPEERQEFAIRARSASLTDGSIVRARHVVPRLYGVPLFYVPYMKRDLESRSNITIIPGYSSRHGAYLLTGYNYYPIDQVRATTQLDYRERRGWAAGQRFRWRFPEYRAFGRFQAYYASDDRPLVSSRQRPFREGLVDRERYWFGLSHVQGVGDRNLLISEVNYLSDPFVLEDFFDSAFRRQVQPENRISFSRRSDNYTAGILLNMRLNDFYNNVNRMPELSLDINRRELGQSGFFYDSDNRAAYLERVFPRGSASESYSAIRLDSSHTVLYPMRHFGFLSVIPRVGYRATGYSALPELALRTNLVTTVDADGESQITEESELVIRDGSADLRHLFEVGLETSFKSFRVWNQRPNYLGHGLRHIAEPYSGYTWIPKPNLRPDDLYQFDAVDQLDRRHDVLIGMRNKLQTRRGGRVRVGDTEQETDQPARRRPTRVHDFIDLNTFTFYRIEPRADERDFDHFYLDTRIRLTDWMQIDVNGAYDWYAHETERLNTQLRLLARDRSSISVEHRYQRDRRETIQAGINLFPTGKWAYQAYWRYDIDAGDLEEQTYLVQRRLDCTRFGIGVRGRQDREGDTEWRVWAQVSLLAFPETELRLGGR